MSRRWRLWRRRETIADCGFRIADWPNGAPLVESAIGNPQSAIAVGRCAVKYFVTVGARTIEVEVDGTRVTVDGVGVETDLAAVSGTPLYHLLLGGESWTVAVEPLEGAGRWGLGLVGGRGEGAGEGGASRGAQGAGGAK